MTVSEKKKSTSSLLGAPSQRNQSSRKGKRAWRKNVDLDEVEEGLEELRAEERASGFVPYFLQWLDLRVYTRHHKELRYRRSGTTNFSKSMCPGMTKVRAGLLRSHFVRRALLVKPFWKCSRIPLLCYIYHSPQNTP